MTKKMKSAVALAACTMLASAPIAQAATCASDAEIAAIQVAAVHEELSEASLACGPAAVSEYNQFQTRFLKELRRSDATMLSMFKRMKGVSAGNAAYDSYKTRAIANAENRRNKPGAAENFCRTADLVFAAALAPDKPVLEDFVSGVPVLEQSPVDACVIRVASNLQGTQAGPDIVPTPRPNLPGDPPNPSLFPD
jgi:hypothetical protein